MNTMRDLIDAASGDNQHSLYETDEHAWLEQQVAALREGRLGDLDGDNLVDFLSEMTRNEQDKLESAFTELLEHMLKISMQPDRVTRSWISSISKQQVAIKRLLRRPNLAYHRDRLFAEAYPAAIHQAVGETGIPAKQFPAQCPWTPDEAIGYEPPPPSPHPSAPRRRGG